MLEVFSGGNWQIRSPHGCHRFYFTTTAQANHDKSTLEMKEKSAFESPYQNDVSSQSRVWCNESATPS
jgi:hypothetical protein